MTGLIIALLVTMTFSAFFSGMEIAFVSSNRLLAEVDREKNGLAQRVIAFFYRHPGEFVSTMLVGNNIALVVYGILFADIFDQTLFANLSDGVRVTADTILSTLVVLFTGEFLPKTIFKSSPNAWLTAFALPAYIIYIVLWPVSRFSAALSRGIMRLFGARVDPHAAEQAFTKVDLDYLVQSSIDNAESDDQEIDQEVKLFHNALDFSQTKVRDCMVPRTEIDAVPVENTTLGQLRSRFTDSGHSKMIVYSDNIDHIIGYIHSGDMFRLVADDHQSPDTPISSMDKLVRTMPFVPETMAAKKMLQTMLAQKKSLAVVVDEFGGTSGLIALEDIVEEIIGEIEDEHDSNNLVAKDLGDGEYMLSARLEIERINEMFHLDLPESDDYMTLGGLILHVYQGFPKLNETVCTGHFEMKIVKKTMTKIELVRLKVLE
ncbi:MAG: hemolysin family protein [Prevotella sp.]|nr:hemolysin family protein [Prevotella sp.]